MWRCVRDLGKQLVGHRLGEGVEVNDLHYKGAWTPDHVLAVIIRQATGRMRVYVEQGSGHAAGFLVDDSKTVDGDALRDRLVPCLSYQPAGIVAAVARHVDDPALGGDTAGFELRDGEIDTGANRGATR